jgi:hypothetical protein
MKLWRKSADRVNPEIRDRPVREVPINSVKSYPPLNPLDHINDHKVGFEIKMASYISSIISGFSREKQVSILRMVALNSGVEV